MKWLAGTQLLVAMNKDKEKEICLWILLKEIKKIKSVDEESSLELQAAWLDACEKFGFHTRSSTGKCSASNIEAFQRMVQEKYPAIYANVSETDKKNVDDIRESIYVRSQYLLDNWSYRGPDIGPTEILEHMKKVGFQKTDALDVELLRMYREHKAQGYLPYFNQYLRENFTEEAVVREFFNGFWKSEHYPRRSIIASLEISTLLILLSRLGDWREVLITETSMISTKTLLGKVQPPAQEEFLEFLTQQSGWDEEKNPSFVSVIKEFISNKSKNASGCDKELGDLICKIAWQLNDDDLKDFLVQHMPWNCIFALPMIAYDPLPNEKSLAERG